MNKAQKNTLFWIVLLGAFLLLMFLIRSVLLPFVLGAAMAYFLDPAADRLQRLKLGRTTAALVITGVFFSLLVLAGFIGIPIIAGQLAELLASLPDYVNQLNTKVIPELTHRIEGISPAFMADIKTSVASSSGMLARTTTDFLGGLLLSGIAFVNILSLILITPVVAFYLLRDWDRIVAHLDSLLPRKNAETVREQCRIIDATLAGFLRGQLNVCILLGLYYAIGLSLVGLNSGFIIGLVTGFLVIFPYVGLLLGMLVGLTVAYFQFTETLPILLVVAVFASGQILEGNFVTPKLVGDKVGLHPVWIIFALLAGGALFGFVGVLIAVPFAAVVGVLIRFAISRYRLSDYFK